MTTDAETARLAQAMSAMPEVANRYDDVLREADAPRRLWELATADAHDGLLDDRPLYWARLKLQAAERISRGFDVDWPSKGPVALVTGFDPFRLGRNVAQSNPAGVAALALHGAVVAGVAIRAAVLPVRFVDFDRGIVEDLLTPVLRRRPVLVLTISMGRRGRFDVERFPSRRRASAKPDNRDASTAGTAREPLPPPGLAGPEFLETTLPVAAMAAVRGRWPVRDNRRVETLRRGPFTAKSLDQLAGKVSVQGSGGAFLSNEIGFRSLWLGKALDATARIGHLHVPSLVGYDRDFVSDVAAQTRRIVEAALLACLESPPAAPPANGPRNG